MTKKPKTTKHLATFPLPKPEYTRLQKFFVKLLKIPYASDNFEFSFLYKPDGCNKWQNVNSKLTYICSGTVWNLKAETVVKELTND